MPVETMKKECQLTGIKESISSMLFLKNIAQKINAATDNMVRWVHGETKHLLKKGKLVGLVGGDHSTPLGYLRALTEIHMDGFGILQIDAHCDLRVAYEGFEHSHASIFYNALKSFLLNLNIGHIFKNNYPRPIWVKI